MVVYEVVSECQGVQNPTQALNNYQHIFIKKCDGEIINAENGERIINLSQFMKFNELNEIQPNTTEPDPRSQLSPKLVIDSDCVMSTQEVETNQICQSSQPVGIDLRVSQQLLAQLNQSLIDHENTVFATSQPISDGQQSSVDCIAYLYSYTEIDSLKIPDQVYYKRC